MALYQDEPEVRTQLEQLGLPLEALLRAVRRGAGGFASTTAFHSRAAAGTYLYHETTAGLRLEMTPHGWEHDEADGQPRIYSQERRLAVVVQTGDANTGIVCDDEPRTRHPKGSATRRKVDANYGQLALFPAFPAGDASRPYGDVRLLTWVLLVAVVDREVRAELSLPKEVTADGRPCTLLERVLLPAQDLGGGSSLGTQWPADEGPDTDIAVAWKQ